MKSKKLTAVVLAGATTVGLGVMAIPGGAATLPHSSVNWATVTHLTKTGPEDFGNLKKAAEAEGHLNVITLPSNWANYGTIISDFSHKYHIAINSENPEGSSQDELNAIKADKGRADDPDVLDLGQSFAIEASNNHELANYQVQTWTHIPNSQKNVHGSWYGDYGGYVSIGCDTKTVKHCPTTFKQMLRTGQGYKIGINNNPTEASAAFSAVYAAALSNGGSFNHIKPGVDWFQKLNKEGNFVATIAGPGTVQIGCDEHRDLVGLPPGLGDQLAPGLQQELESRDPERRRVCGLLRPGDQQGRPGPRGGTLVGGVLVLHNGAEPVAQGQGTPDRASVPDQESPGIHPSGEGTAAGAKGDHQVPDSGSAQQGQGSCRTVLAD